MGKMETLFEQMRKRREDLAAMVEEKDESVEQGTLAAPEAPIESTEAPIETVNSEDSLEETNEEELDEAVKKVVKDGKVTTKTVSTVKKRLTSAQKKALAAARKKAHTSSANKSRAKSLKVRAKAGLNDEEAIICPECGFEGVQEDFEEEEGHLYCPECGADVCCTDSSCEEVDVAELAARLEAAGSNSFMVRALNEGKYDLVAKYLEIKEGE
jgi:predicted RNA-binding Zn-ribbon protein involved in translation (DUF1610 family)